MNRAQILASIFGSIGTLALAFPAGAAEPPSTTALGPAENIQEPGKTKVSDEAQKLSKQAISKLEKGDSEGARKDFEKVLTLVPGNLPTLINLGLVEYRQKKLTDAEVHLKAAVKGASESGLPWLILGVVQFEQGKLEAAFASLAMSAYLEPKDARTHHYLGVVMGSKGWYSAAEDEMRKAIELAPEYAEAHYNLAVFYLERQPPAVELARRHYYKSIDLGGAPDPEIEKKLPK